MANVYLDREEDGRIRVTVLTGVRGRKVEHFADRVAAERFAESRMGRRGSVMSTLDMTPDQLAAHQAREARTAALLAKARGVA